MFALASTGRGSAIVTPLPPGGRRVLETIDHTRPAAVLVVESVGTGLARGSQLVRIDVRGQREVLHRDRARIVGHALHPDGRLAYVQRVEGESLVLHRVRAPGRLQRVLTCTGLRRCRPMAATADGSLLLRGDVDGDRLGLLKLDRSGALLPLHRDPGEVADLDDLVLDPLSQRPLVATYSAVRPRHHGLTREARAVVDAATRALPDALLRFQRGRGPHARWLISESASDLQGERWHVFDPRVGRLNLLLDDEHVLDERPDAVPALPASALARKVAFVWRASDGMRLHGFLSLPPGRDPRALPLIAHVHGGPWNHDGPGFSATVQFLVNRGYAVFEPNFRGSTGHGRAYMQAANGDFGNGRVQKDVIDGVQALLDAGIGARGRVGISGASYGGYSALLGLTFAPDLFKAGVAIVPPPDFGWNARWITRAPEARDLSRQMPINAWMRLAKVDVDDAATLDRLHRESPLANVTRVGGPVLLVAGARDRRVAVAGVVEYAARLKVAGKDVTLVIDPQAGHRNDDATAREATLFAIEALFSAHLGGARGAPPPARVDSYLRRNLRLSGTAFHGRTN